MPPELETQKKTAVAIRRLGEAQTAFVRHARGATGVVALVATLFALGLASLERTGDIRLQIAATVAGICVFAWLYATAASHGRGPLVGFLFAWSLFAVWGFTARTDGLMGSDIHREYRALLFFGDAARWDPLALPEVSFSSAWLIMGTRVLADMTGLAPFDLLKYLYPSILAGLAIPLFLAFERTLGARAAFASVFAGVSLISFWESTSQIAKASVALFLAATLLYALVTLPTRSPRTYLVGGVLMLGFVLTHYTSSVLVLAILGLAWAAEALFHALRRRSWRVTFRASRGFALLVGFGVSLYAAWYWRIPYVSGVIESNVRRPAEFLFAALIGDFRFLSRGQSVGATLGEGSTPGYWSLKMSLSLLALFLVAGWAAEARAVLSGRTASRRRIRLFWIQTITLLVTAVGFLLPTHLDANRLFAICLILAASLLASWSVHREGAGMGRAMPRSVASAILVGGVVALAASQMGLVFLALDGTPFSTNLGNAGPVHDYYAHDRESLALRDWAVASNGAAYFAGSRNAVDFFHEDPRVSLEAFTDLQPEDVARLVGPGSDHRAVVCLAYDPQAPVQGPAQAVFTTGRTFAFTRCERATEPGSGA